MIADKPVALGQIAWHCPMQAPMHRSQSSSRSYRAAEPESLTTPVSSAIAPYGDATSRLAERLDTEVVGSCTRRPGYRHLPPHEPSPLSAKHQELYESRSLDYRDPADRPLYGFLSEGGKLWPRVKAVAEEVQLPSHLRKVVLTARTQDFKIISVPHHRWRAGDYLSFDNPSPHQLGSAKAQVFAKDSRGGTFHDDLQPQAGDVVALEHWGSSGFANTDLDLQLKQHSLRRIVLIGMIANTCIESTGRFGMELGVSRHPG
jgi:Isochorismatase family